MNKCVFATALAVLSLLVVSPGRSEFQPVELADTGGVRGDVDQSGGVDIFDLLAILRQISGKEPATEHSDLDNNGKTDIFDLLALLRRFGDLKQPLEVAATVGGHWLTEPIVYSYSQSWENNGVTDRYRIYSSREIDRAEFILSGDTLTDISGTTPVLFAADPDTVQIETSEDYIAYSGPKHWRISVWDKQGNCVSDSGDSQFVVLYPGLHVDGSPNNVSEEIAFPLTLHGSVQRFGIKAVDHMGPVGYSTFTIDLNPESKDSVIYGDIEQLAARVMEQVVEQVESGEGPTMFVSAAVPNQTKLITGRLVISLAGSGISTSVFALDGNTQLVSKLGFQKWIQEIQGATHNGNFSHDPAVYEYYQ